jgi:CRP-like cAMP-binding protein
MNEQLRQRAVGALDRIALVLAALHADGMGESKQGVKAERLSRLGFSNAQIADALGSTENSVNVSRVRRRKSSGSRPAKSKRR